MRSWVWRVEVSRPYRRHTAAIAAVIVCYPGSIATLDYLTANSCNNSGWFTNKRIRQSTTAGGAKRPCYQSRSVGTGVAIRSANEAWVNPERPCAWRTRICSGVVTRPEPALASASAWRRSGIASPPSASIALATFSMSISRISNAKQKAQREARLPTKIG